MSVETGERAVPGAGELAEGLPREFRGDQKYGLIAMLVGTAALLFSSYICGSSVQWDKLAFVGLLLGLPTLLGAIVLFFKAYDTFAKKLVVDSQGLNFQHHSTVLLQLPWDQIEALVAEPKQGGGMRYQICTADDTLTIANLERQEELLALLSRLSGRAWQQPRDLPGDAAC